jgi:hypothetical protein
MHSVKAITPSRRAWFSVPISALLCLVSCSQQHPLTDDQMIQAFNLNRELFEQMARQSLDRPDCPYANNPHSCVPRDAKLIESRLRQTTQFPIERISIIRNATVSLWIPIQTYGALSMSSATRGYVYCKCSLGPTTRDTLEAAFHGENGEWFRPIGGDWMLYGSR